ncbi:MAG: glycosyltransferase family 2 protein [Nanoarchaeota archaeon]
MKRNNLLSIIIPVYNEAKTIKSVLNLVLKSKLSIKKEIIIINDGSTDDTQEIVDKFIQNNHKINIRLLNKKNEGKGSAVKLGIMKATGQIIIIQDADLEYNPEDYERCIQPIINGKYKVVYGSRVIDRGNIKYRHLSYLIGGRTITLFTNILFGSRLTDEPTCYKTFDSDLIKSININGKKFDWEPEITAKILRMGIKIKEVPIRYYPRSIKEGKKIRWKDGLDAIITLIKYRLI